MTHAVAPPALDRDSRAPGLASVTSANEVVAPQDVARRTAGTRPGGDDRDDRLRHHRGDRLQPSLRGVGLPERPGAHRRRRPWLVVRRPPAARSTVRRHPLAARRAHVAGRLVVLPGHVQRILPARRDVGDRARRLPSRPRRLPVDDAAGCVRRRLGVPRRGHDGRDGVARRHVRLPRPGSRRGARPGRRAVRLHRRPRSRRAPDRHQPGGRRCRLLCPRPAAPAARTPPAHGARPARCTRW